MALDSRAGSLVLMSLLAVCAHACTRALPGPRAARQVSSPAKAEHASATIVGPLAACADTSAVDVVQHDIELILSLRPASLSGSGRVRVRARRATSVVVLDADRLRVLGVSAGASPVRYRQDHGRLCIALARSLSAGAELTLALEWQVQTAGDTPHFAPDQVWAGYNAATWMPTLQNPAQRATLALRVRAPAALKVVASGRRLSSLPAADGLLEHSFVLTRPAPPFLYAFAAGQFDQAELEVDGQRLRALGPPGADLQAALAITAPMLRFLSARTGAALFDGEYVQVFVHGDAAQEAAGLAFISVDALAAVRDEPEDDWIFSHELAHQWFAWRIPCADFADFWLNEGFATFFVAAVKEQRWGRAAYEREVARWRERSAKVHAEGRDAPLSLSDPNAAPRTAPSESELQPRGVTYFRGALVLHKLRAELGELAFWRAIQGYVHDRAEKGARSEDLRTSFEAASGRDLKAFFARWVYQSAPDL